MNTPRMILYLLSMLVAVALIFAGVAHLVVRELNGGLLQIGVGLCLVLLNSSRADRA